MRKCDLVMKGGITSGIVYPAAVCELARDFEFANIGGTSAGAIAAALTAAAEYRRQHGSSAGFDELAALPAWLGETDGDRSRLLRLFQPVGSLAPLLDAFMRRSLGALLHGFHRFSGAVAAITAVMLAVIAAAAYALSPGAISVGLIVVAFMVIAFGAVAYVVATVIDALFVAGKELPKNGFGICSGMGDNALTQWLAGKIDAIAQRPAEAPLTYGDLDRAGIHVEMMTTNLTHGRPYTLPFENNVFMFVPSELERLFPKRIVDWLVAHSPQSDDGFYALPEAADLPLVVMARMSLSFPILLSAIPLYAIDFGRRDEHKPERCWFSDGGITSNFPVQFFDAPLPRWPTFAINLAEQTPRYHAPGQRVYLPSRNSAGIREWWIPFDSIIGFLAAIVNTMQNWRDNMLLRVPGYRDRIAHVLLAPHEGGLNLTMDPATITDVADRGREAAGILRERFGENPPPDAHLTWKNHKWVRFLTFMTALEESMKKLVHGFRDPEPPSYEGLVTGAESLPSYKITGDAFQAIEHAALQFVQHAADDFYDDPFETPKKSPRPRPTLGLRPKM